MRYWIAALGVLLMATGCASTRASIARATGEHDMAVSASPGPDLVGTWRGRAWVLAGTVNEFNSVAVDLTIKPDGTWSWSTKGQEQGHGRVAVRGNGVTLHETWSRHGNTDATNAAQETIVLKRTGDELWGVTRAFMPSAQNAVELKRVAP